MSYKVCGEELRRERGGRGRRVGWRERGERREEIFRFFFFSRESV
jgi:hypothetical protein